MTAFTIFNHGTAASRDGQGEIVAEFGRLAAGTEYKDFLICDGPGSDPRTSVMPGRFNPFTRYKSTKDRFGYREMGNTHINCRWEGMLTGSGWDDNVMHAVATIAQRDTPPSVINMLGWSRGAVTCGKLAYKLQEFFPQIPVNIFAVDPVAGVWNQGDIDAGTVHGNVKNYCAVLSMHENRRFFAPQDAQRVRFTNPGTNAVFIPFPGSHDVQVKLDKNVIREHGESAQMVWFLAWKFLTKFGTRFKSAPSPDYDDLTQCNLYARMQLKLPEYSKTRFGFGSALFMGGRCTRDFVKVNIDQYVKHSAFFLNEHHRRLFERTLPHLYTWIFESRNADAGAVARDFMKTQYHTALRRTLVNLGFGPAVSAGSSPTIPPAGGGHQASKLSPRQTTAKMSRMGFYA